MTAPVKVVVVDDQSIVREGLVVLLGLLDGLEVSGSFADIPATVAGLAAMPVDGRPDVFVVDIGLPGTDGIAGTPLLLAQAPGSCVLLLTTLLAPDTVRRAITAGARGVVTKDATGAELRQAIVAAAAGQTVFDPAATAQLTGHWAASAEPADRSDAVASGGAHPAVAADGLTDRELDVLRAIAVGLDNTEIAAALYISTATVKTHINNLFAKIGARHRGQAAAYAYRHLIATPPTGGRAP